MSENIVIALIGAGGAIVAALVGGVFALINRKSAGQEKLKVSQKQKGKNNTQIGVQNNYGRKRNDE